MIKVDGTVKTRITRNTSLKRILINQDKVQDTRHVSRKKRSTNEWSIKDLGVRSSLFVTYGVQSGNGSKIRKRQGHEIRYRIKEVEIKGKRQSTK